MADTLKIKDLPIEARKGYNGAAASKGAAKKDVAKSKRDARPGRLKSVKARYVKGKK